MLVNVCWLMVQILIFVTVACMSIELVLAYKAKIAQQCSREMKLRVRPDPYEVKMDTADGYRARSVLMSDRFDIRIRNMIEREMADILLLVKEVDKLAFRKNVDRILETAYKMRKLKHRITSHLMELLRKTNNFNLLKFIELTPLRRLIKYKRIEEEVTSWI